MAHKLVGAEIFKVGTHNGLDFSAADLDAIVNAFDALKDTIRVPLKFGHNNEQTITDGQPALGWVDRVWKDGIKLLADFSGVPTVVFEAIKNGLYRNVSIELLKDVGLDGGAVRPWVLDGVALLGADSPAVRGLKDLQALTMSAKGLKGVRIGAQVAFTQSINIGASKTMTNEELQAALDAANQKLDAQTKAMFTEKVAAHRAKIVSIIEDAIKAKEIDPRIRARVEASKAFKSDDDVLTVWTEDEVKAEIRANRREDFNETGAKTKVKTNNESALAVGKSNAEAVTFRAQEEAKRVGHDPMNVEHLSAATKRLFKQDTKLARAYFDDPHGEYKPTTDAA